MKYTPDAVHEPQPEGEAATLDDFEPHGLRLRSRSLWAGLGVALLSLIPYEIIDDQPQLIWDLFGELPPAAILATLTPFLMGIIASLAGRWTRYEANLGLIIAATLLGGAAIMGLGVEAGGWSALPLPEGLNLSPGFALLALALPAAGASLTADPDRGWSLRWGRLLLLLALPAAAAFYLIPRGGEALGAQIYHFLVFQLSWTTGVAYFSTFTFAIALYWPAVIALFGLLYVFKPARDEMPIFSLAATFGLPLFWGLWTLRGLLTGQGAWAVFTSLGMACVLASAVALIASTLATLAARRPQLKTTLGAAGALLIIIAIQARLSTPPPKGVDWQLKPRDEATDALYMGALPTWNRARMRWVQGEMAGTAQAYVALKAAEATLMARAEALDEGLSAAIRALSRDSMDAGVAGRRWTRAIQGVNDAAQAASLPYYLDPTVYFFKRGEGMRRLFQLKVYAVERVDAVEVEGRAFAALHVARLDRGGGSGALLGFSRDAQPFAVVQRAEIDAFEEALKALAAQTPARCLESPIEGNFECGQWLIKLIDDGALKGLDAAVSRHELQHQIDGPGLPISGVFRRLNRDLSAQSLGRLNRELSAYTAELVSEEADPRLSLILTLRAAAGGGLSRVGRLILHGLWRPEVLDAEALPEGEVALAEAHLGLMALTPAEIRARAAALWARLYSEQLRLTR
ncbi:hypothetical protein KKB55_09940 [Myxococcota bacterium]|nr:hypothetical protein [Myxococcota bacterium]MBU1898055.1 hypothetical protein [Myxococcota bacterium]